jgi:TP901 family phage tail tape measure protein
MAGDTNTNIFIGIDTTQAMAQLRALEKELTALNRAMITGTSTAAREQARYAQSLMHNVNATGLWTASTMKMSSATEQFADSLDKGKLSLKEYYRYGMASTKTFGKFFGSEFSTVSKLVDSRVKTLQQQYVQLGRDANGALNAMKFRPKTLNYSDLTTSLMLATQRHQLLNKLIDDGSTKLLNFGKNTQWAGRQLMVGFTIPLIMFAGQAIKSFKELETQVIRFKKVYGDIYTDSGESAKALKDIRALADEYTAYGVKVADTIKMAADAAAMGNTGENLKNIVRQTTDLAVLGGITQEQALNTTIALQNAFDIRGSELKKTVDFLNATENQTVLSLEDITAAIPRVAPVVKALGGNVQDLTYFLTAMKEGGISAEQGANALKSGLASLINPTNSATKAANQYGISIKGIVKANEGNLRNTVVGFANALKPLTDLQRAQVIEKVFGKYQFARMSTLLNNLTKDGSQAARVLQLTTASAEELAILTEREKKTQADSAMNKLAQAVERLKVAIAPVGEMFAKMVIPIAEFFQKIFDKFSSLPEGVKKFAGIMVTAIGGIGPILLMTVGLVANGIANILKLFNLMRKGYQQLAYGSQDVALKTQYLSQEELENASITNALYTKHEALSASYRLEAQSLGALMNVYRQANTSMGAFAANNSGLFVPRGIAPKKFASGTESVPGPRGAGDIVPAMLSPGEAVIPAKQTKKYGGFISQILKDNVPGFATGPGFWTPPKVKGSAIFGPAAEVFTPKIDLSRPTSTRALGVTRFRPLPGGDKPQVLPRSNVSSLTPFSFIPNPKDPKLTDVFFNGDFLFTRKFNSVKDQAKYNEKYGAFKAKNTNNSDEILLRNVRDLLSRKNAQDLTASKLFSSTLGGKRTSPVSSAAKSRRTQYQQKKEFLALQKYFKEEEDLIRSHPSMTMDDLVKLTAPAARIDGQRLKDVIREKQDRKLFRLSPALSHGEAAKTNKRTAEQDVASNLFEDTNQMNLVYLYNGNRSHISTRREAELFLDQLKSKKNPNSFDKYGMIALEKRLKDGFYEKFKTRQDDLLMLSNGIMSVPGPKGAGDIQPAMLAPGEAVIPAKQSKKYSGLISGIMSNQIPGFENGPGTWTGNPGSWRTPGSLDDPWETSPSRGTKGQDRVERAIDKFFDKPRVKKLGDRIDKFAAQMGKTTPKVAQLGVTASQTTKDFGTDKTRGFRGFMSGYSRVPQTDETGTRLTAAQRTNARQAMRMERSQRMMGVGMASMMVPMVAGAYAAKNPDSGVAKNMDKIMMASMLPMLIPLINSPAKILATSLIGLAAVFKLQSGQIKQSLADGEKQAKAMTMTTDNLEQLGKYTQKVSAGQIAAAQRAGRTKDITPVSMDYGTNFLGSDAGKQFKANFDSTIKTLGASGTAQAASVVATQLATAVQQGVLTSDQAESIAIKLTRDLNDATLEMSVRGKLIELLGPNGQNLTIDPLSVQVKLIAEGKTLQEAVFLNLQQALNDVNQGIGPNMKLNPLKGVGGRRANEQAGGAILGNPMNWSETAQMQGLAATVGSASFIKILNTVRTARAATAAATAGTAAATAGTAGVASPALIAAAGSLAITSTAEWLLRKWQQGEEKKFIAKNAGTLAGIVSQNILAGQQGIDAVTKEYDTALANLEVKKSLAKTENERSLVEQEILKIQIKKESALATLRASQAAQAKTAADYYDSIGSEEGKSKYLSAYRTQMVNKFKDDPYQKAQAEALSTQIKGTTAKAQIEVMTLVNSDQMTVSQAKALTTTLLSTGQKNIDRTINTIINLQGTEGVSRLAGILEFIPNPVNQRNILVSVKNLDPAAANEVYSGLEELIKIPDYVGVKLDLETQKDDINEIKRLGKETTSLKKAFPNGKIDLKVLTDLQQKSGGPGQNLTLDKAIEKWDILSKLPKELQFQAMITLGALDMSDSIKTMLDREVENSFMNANPSLAYSAVPGSAADTAKKQAFESWKKSEAGIKATMKATKDFYSNKLTEIFGTEVPSTVKGGSGGASGTGTKQDNSWLIDLAQKLKLVKDSSIDALNPLKSIQKFLGGDLSGQGGGSVKSNTSLDKQLGAIRQIDDLALAGNIGGLSDDFRDILMSMDPEQFKIWSKTLFEVGKDGRIKGLKQAFIDINSAFKTSTIGKYIEDERKATDEIRDRANAYYRLTDIAKEYKFTATDTVDLLKNQSLVGDIANGIKYSKEELETLVAINKERREQANRETTTKQFQDNAQIQIQIDAFKKLKDSGIEFQTILQIIGKPDWAANVLDATGKIQDEFPNMIKSATEYRNLLFELQQLQETKTDKMGQKFAAENAKITAKAMADFRKTNGMSVQQYQVITQERENAKQALQDQIDILNGGFTVFDKLETSINDSYTEKNKLIDEQISALQKVSQINEEIASQQKDQLDLASAITSGDISAAAQAAEQYRANRAKSAEASAVDALNVRKDILEKQKLKDIAALTTVINGVTYTRQQLTDKIALIEEGQLKTLIDEITARNRVIETYDQSIAKALALVQINGYSLEEYEAIKTAVAAVNDALDSQILNIDDIISSVGGVEAAWLKVAAAASSVGVNNATATTKNTPKETSTAKIVPIPLSPSVEKVDQLAQSISTRVETMTVRELAKYGGNPVIAEQNLVDIAARGLGPRYGGMLKGMFAMASGGVVPKYFASGGYSVGTDTVPAMLTPGEFVVKRFAVKKFGVENLKAINDGTYRSAGSSVASVNNNSNSVYNYGISVNVSNTNASTDDIAKAVITQIRNIDNQRIRGQR